MWAQYDGVSIKVIAIEEMRFYTFEAMPFWQIGHMVQEKEKYQGLNQGSQSEWLENGISISW